MSQGKAVQIKTGLKHTDTIYAQLKNGSVYRLKSRIKPEHQTQFVNKIVSNDRVIQLQNWVKVV